MNEMTLPSRHRIPNSSPDCQRLPAILNHIRYMRRHKVMVRIKSPSGSIRVVDQPMIDCGESDVEKYSLTRSTSCVYRKRFVRIKPEELYIISFEKGRGRRPRPFQS